LVHAVLKNSSTNRFKQLEILDGDGTLWDDDGTGVFQRRTKVIFRSNKIVTGDKSSFTLRVLYTNQTFFARNPRISLQHLAKAFLFYFNVTRYFKIDLIIFCSHHPSAQNYAFKRNCGYRKPSLSGYQNLKGFTQIAPTKWIVLGDRITDILGPYALGATELRLILNPRMFDLNTGTDFTKFNCCEFEVKVLEKLND